MISTLKHSPDLQGDGAVNQQLGTSYRIFGYEDRNIKDYRNATEKKPPVFEGLKLDYGNLSQLMTIGPKKDKLNKTEADLLMSLRPYV